MQYLWISPHFMYRYNEWHRVNNERANARLALKGIIQFAIEPEKNDILKLPHITSSTILDGKLEFKVAYNDSVADVVMLLDFQKSDVKPGEIKSIEGTRALLLSDDVIRGWVGNGTAWESYCKGLCDAALIDSTKKRPNNFKFYGSVSSIFLPSEYRRMHMVDLGSIGLNVILGEFDSMLWASHGKVSQTVKQPRGTEIDSWERLHSALTNRYSRIHPTLTWRLSTPPPPISPSETADTWVNKEQLKEIGITTAEEIKAVMACRQDDDLINLIDILNESQWTKLDMLYSRHLAQIRRRDEKTVGSIAQYELNISGSREANSADYDKWQVLLTSIQKDIVNKSLLLPIRLKGGPGTGKTLTAVLRAAALLKHAKEMEEPFRLGFFVFNRDLGRKIYQQFLTLGLAGFLNGSEPQQLVVTNLMEWCEKFLDLDNRGIEPIAPYRAERMDKQREALYNLVIEEAKNSLVSQEYENLWKEFDTRSKNGLREIETEISQFIKAKGIPSLSAYLGEQKPTQWVRQTDKEFRKFVWEVYQVYDSTLKSLRMVDADDLVNDCFRQVSQTVWQKFDKEKQGFDYLILDEAHDFFRHQIHLMAALVKDERNIMMCYDEGQMVYSRYPTLREMGYDTNERFYIRRLEVNFRNSKQILASLQALIAAYPVYDYNSLWGQITSNPKSPESPKPNSQGYQSDSGMMRATAALVKKHIENGVDPREIAIICFDDDTLKNIESIVVREADIKIHHLTGQGKHPPKNSVVLTTARQVKGEQFDVCILVGASRDNLPDFRGGEGEVWFSQKREDDFRLFAVAMSRCKRHLYFVWTGTQPSEFIEAMGDTIEVHG
ncbi:MAG: DEAD/DEAH box helicase [Anaerolineae bacterium]|nr:DEAD/DEAH box helicase [Anaerolineae bacterium]MBL8106769.1 DEAD/DEAH box helicase [Anaerolineales bacterium]MCC7190115.1 DEAD/DEAH box helicase [Anaerolineales bacterium]